jgi:hypothetical protein
MNLCGIVFWAIFYPICGAGLLGVYAAGFYFGIPAMFGVVFLITLLALRCEPQVVYDDLPEHDWLSPPSKPQLRAPGPRQITRTQGRTLPGRKSRGEAVST